MHREFLGCYSANAFAVASFWWIDRKIESTGEVRHLKLRTERELPAWEAIAAFSSTRIFEESVPMRAVSESAELFKHVSTEKAAFYRCVMDVFAAAKRQYRLQLRPDEVFAEAVWPDAPPHI